MKRPVVVISINASWNIVNFRAGLVRALTDAGYDVVALAPKDDFSHRIPDIGASFHAIEMDQRGTSPVNDARLAGRYYRALRHIGPAVYLGYTVKPNIYGSLAAHALGIPVINNVAGLGVAFLSRNWLNLVVRSMYRLAFRRSKHVFFQNPDDLQLFRTAKLVAPGKTSLLPGSGVDVDRFRPGETPTGRNLTFLLVSRLLWPKGIAEFVEAAGRIKRAYPACRFQIAGIIEEGRREAVPLQQVRRWEEEGTIEYLGSLEDVRPALSAANVVVLPSYYPEGTPRSLLEAAAMGKPIVTCDVPGCREIVQNGLNGLLCSPRNVDSLVSAMLQMIEMPSEQLREMGTASRRQAEERFDERIVIRQYLEEIEKVVPPSLPTSAERHSGPAQPLS